MAILAGQDLTATLLNGAISGPIANLRQATTQTLANGTYTSISFDSEDIDTDNGHSNVTNNTRYTIQRTGYYELSGGVMFAANTTGGRATRWTVNGTPVNASSNQVPANAATLLAGVAVRTIIRFCLVADFIELQGYQGSGGNLDTFASAQDQSSMSIKWIRE